MLISNMRLLGRLRQIRLECPVYKGGDRLTDTMLDMGLLSRGMRDRVALTGHGASALRWLAGLEAKGELLGCWATPANDRLAPLGKMRASGVSARRTTA